MVPEYDAAHNGYPAEHLNGTHGAAVTAPVARFQLWKQEQHTPSWHDQEPGFVHSLKYTIDGTEHMTVIRADDIDELWKRVRTVMELVRVARERKSAPPVEQSQPPAPAEADKGFCAVHNAWMTRHTKGESSWYSHKHDGGWCRGGGK